MSLTQLEAARTGQTTPEMESAARREDLSSELIREEVAAGRMVIMPGGVDMHCHIAGPKVNVARKMRPEEKRRDEPIPRTPKTHSGTMGSVPSTFATGYKYVGMGYTTAFDAAVPPLSARHALNEQVSELEDSLLAIVCEWKCARLTTAVLPSPTRDPD